MGDEELESTSDLAGPFKTLQRAREVFKSKVIEDEFLNTSLPLNDYLHEIVRYWPNNARAKEF